MNSKYVTMVQRQKLLLREQVSNTWKVDGDGQQQQPFNGRLSGTTRVGQYQKKQYQKKHG